MQGLKGNEGREKLVHHGKSENPQLCMLTAALQNLIKLIITTLLL